MKKSTRRDFMMTAGLGITAASLIGSNEISAESSSKSQTFQLGMASYTFREFNLEDTLKMTKRLNLKNIAFKSYHLPLESTQVEIETVSSKVKKAGLNLYGCGVVYMKNKEEVQRAFHYAKFAGMKVIIGVPQHELIELVNEKIKEFDIKVAIHNHGPGDKLYPTAESAYSRIKEMDPRFGLCLDIGHTQRVGEDPSIDALNFADRLLDVHIKDVSASTKDGSTIEIGRGVIDVPKFIKTLKKINYQHMVSFEFEKDGKDPLPGTAESVGYVRGVLSVI